MKTMKYSMVFLFSFFVILSTTAQKMSKTKKEKRNEKKSIECCQNHSGKTPIVINLDFTEKKFENLDRLEELKKGDLYQLRIKNINLNLYNVLIENKDSLIKTDIPLFPFDLMNLDNLSKIIAELSPISTISESTKIGFGGDVALTKDSIISKNRIIERMNLESKFLLTIKDSIYYSKISIDSLQFSMNKRALSYIVENNNSDYYNYLKSSFNMENALKSTEKIRMKIKGILDKLKESFLKYQTFYTENKAIIDKTINLNKRNKEINEAYAKAIESINNVYTSIDANKVYTWFNSLILLENNNSGEYLSLPMQKAGDITNFKIKVVPKKSEYGLSSYQSNLQFPTYTKPYLGIGMGFYISTMYNEAFSINSTKVDTVTSYNVIDEKPLHSEIGFATLLYYGVRFNNSNCGIHLTFGPAFSISNKISPRLAVGGGFSFGKKQMLTVDFMAIAGYAERLSKVYSVDGIFTVQPQNITVSKLKYGGAISFGYIYKF